MMVSFEDTFAAIPAGVLNMPDPIVAPIAIILNAKRDKPWRDLFMRV
jgi:hypothetical protein